MASLHELKAWLEQLIQSAAALQAKHEQEKYQLIGERAAFEAVLTKLRELDNARSETTSNSDQLASASERATAPESADV